MENKLKTTKFKATWTPEIDEELKSFHHIDAEKSLSDMLAKELKFETVLRLKLEFGGKQYTDEQKERIENSPELMGLYAKHVIKSDYIPKPKRR